MSFNNCVGESAKEEIVSEYNLLCHTEFGHLISYLVHMNVSFLT